jgi:16S rRNA C967 or C1407 C5-methylase (RsmB/RsmF family)
MVLQEVNLFVNFQLNNLLFEKYFSTIYGDRWPKLRESLALKEKQVLRTNLFIDKADSAGLEKCNFLDNCFWKPEVFSLQKNSEGHYPYYVMDPASVIVARALEAKPEEKVLDLCAAPGGKSLILSEAMRSGELISNEMSDSRRERLLRVYHEYIPKDQRLFINVKGLDGNQYGLRQPAEYDRVLADVPCSGERHLLENPKEFNLWTEKRTKHLAVRQYSLLSSAWLTVKVGGRIVYSTCSISPEENDKVVAKLIKKREVRILRPEWLKSIDFLEKTENGYQILPDRTGFGPMYFSVIEKN